MKQNYKNQTYLRLLMVIELLILAKLALAGSKLIPMNFQHHSKCKNYEHPKNRIYKSGFLILSNVSHAPVLNSQKEYEIISGITLQRNNKMEIYFTTKKN